MEFLATVSKALEEVLSAEMRDLGLSPRRHFHGIVPFEGEWVDAFRANLHLRTARRILLVMGKFRARSAEELYREAVLLDWPRFFERGTTFAVEASVKDAFSNHSGFVALKVKDAVADACRHHSGRRPDVDRRDPDVRVAVRIFGGRCTLSLDTSGGPLHKRGYRIRGVEAPLNETLAAGILALADYDGGTPFCDPMCGSGTFLVEAGLRAANVAPGLLREQPFGFERWRGVDTGPFEAMRDEARRAVREVRHPIEGSDLSPRALDAAAANVEAAGLASSVGLHKVHIDDFRPPGEAGILCVNPPYGDRLGDPEKLAALYAALGDALKQRCAGYRAYVLAGNPALAKKIGLRPSRRIPLFNGPTECRLLRFELYEGSRKKSRQAAGHSGGTPVQ